MVTREELATYIIEGMDMDALLQYAFDCLIESYEAMDDKSFAEFVQETCPEILEDE